MDSDRDDSSGRVRLPGSGGWDRLGPAGPTHPVDAPYSAERPSARRYGLRRARRVSNWTAAALIAGTGAAAVALAHPAAAPTAAPAGVPAATGAGGAVTAPGATGPQVSHSVATTSGSGVTTTTTTRTVNGKTIVTHVRHVPAYTDN
jgi:hypothetical protein